MKTLLTLLTAAFLSSEAHAGPMEIMNARIKTHEESFNCAVGKQSDEGLFTEISCEVSCGTKSKQNFQLSETFLPESLGLEPGNGSNGSDNIIWGSLSITLKTWSQEKCLEKAKEVCGNYEKITSSEVAALTSGEWKLKRFPGCEEKEVSVSPFDEGVKSRRLEKMVKKVAESIMPAVQINHSKIHPTYPHGKLIQEARALSFEKKNCQKPIKAKICFGDCIDLSKSYTLETLGTPEPLGRSVVELCGDELSTFMKKKKLSPNVKKTLCEDFFWNSMKLKKETTNSCAAMRGEVDCSQL